MEADTDANEAQNLVFSFLHSEGLEIEELDLGIYGGVNIKCQVAHTFKVQRKQKMETAFRKITLTIDDGLAPTIIVMQK